MFGHLTGKQGDEKPYKNFDKQLGVFNQLCAAAAE